MTVRHYLNDWAEKHPIAWLFVKVLSAVAGTGAFVAGFLSLKPITTRFVNAGLVIDWRGNRLDLETWFFVLLWALVAITVFFALLYAWSRKRTKQLELEQREPQTGVRGKLLENEKRAKVAVKTLDGMMVALHTIQHQLLPAEQRPRSILTAIKNTYLVHKNFDTEVRREFGIKAAVSAIRFVPIAMTVEPAADTAEFLEDINFKVRDETGFKIAYLQTKNNLREKAVLLFFLPQIDPGIDQPRRIVVSYRWPGMFKQLDTRGFELYFWEIASEEPVQKAEFAIYMEPGTGKNLVCEIARPPSCEYSLSPATHPTHRWPGWAYEISDARDGRYELNIKLKEP